MLRDSYHEIEMQYTCLEEVPRNILKYGQIRAVLSYPMVSSLWVMGYRFDPSSTFESNKTETIGTEGFSRPFIGHPASTASEKAFHVRSQYFSISTLK